MRCAEKFLDDRICDMCHEVMPEEYMECRAVAFNNVASTSMLAKIKRECKFKTETYDEYTPFNGCNKNGKGLGRFAEQCVVTEECVQYKKDRVDCAPTSVAAKYKKYYVCSTCMQVSVIGDWQSTFNTHMGYACPKCGECHGKNISALALRNDEPMDQYANWFQHKMEHYFLTVLKSEDKCKVLAVSFIRTEDYRGKLEEIHSNSTHVAICLWSTIKPDGIAVVIRTDAYVKAKDGRLVILTDFADTSGLYQPFSTKNYMPDIMEYIFIGMNIEGYNVIKAEGVE